MTERSISFVEAVREAVEQEMSRDDRVIVFGLGVDDPKAIQGTTEGLLEKFGSERVFDTPLSEDAMTGAAVGMAIAGLRPVHVHIRMDFMLLAMNQLVNMAAKTHYMYGGQFSVPLVVRSMIGKSWGQGPQHSQALHSLFCHIPGLKVVAPSNPHDAKGCLISAVRDNNPVIYVEHRLLHFLNGPVAEDPYEVGPGKARVTGEGSDITIVGASYMQVECLRAKYELESVGVSAEVIDPIWLSPLDLDTICSSVNKTGRLLVVDNGWLNCGFGSSVVASVVCDKRVERKLDVDMIGFEQVTCPTSPVLEDAFYPDVQKVASKAYKMVKGDAGDAWMPEKKEYPESTLFKGPF